MFYNSEGEPEIFGFAIEEKFGHQWVSALARAEGISERDAAEILEHGANGRPLETETARARCWPANRSIQ